MDYRLGALEGRPVGERTGKLAGPPRLSAAPSPPPVQKIIPGQARGFAAPPGNLGKVSVKAVQAIAPPLGDDKGEA